MKRKIVPLAKQVADAEAAVVAQRGRPYLDALYRSKRIGAEKFELMGMLERLGVLNFELGKLSGAADFPASPAPASATTSSAQNAAVAPKQESAGAAAVGTVTVTAAATTSAALAPRAATRPSLENLRALAAVLWPSENVQAFEAIERRIWFDRLQVPGFDRAALDAKYGSRPAPYGRSRMATAIDQAKVDAFFEAEDLSDQTSDAAPAPSIPDLAQLRAVAAQVLPGRDYWAMSAEEIHKVLWQEHLSLPGMDDKALAAKYWRPAANSTTVAKVVRTARQSRIETLLTEKLAFK